jgi:hypothetical protein
VLERSSKNFKILSEQKTEGPAMSDADLAANLLEEVIGYRGVREPIKGMLERAYGALSKHNKKWTRRRVRSIFNKETTRIDHREIMEMRAVIQAREEHAAYQSETARIHSMAVRPKASEDRLGTS